MSDLSAGLIDLSGKQRFACSSHFWDGLSVYTGWVKFITDERMAHLKIGDVGDHEVFDAWPLC